jgi:outer membrane receptor protein involved in Fe transport
MGISGYSGIGGGLYLPIIDANNTFQYSGTIAYVKGSHNIRAGASLIRRQLNYFQDSLAPQGGFGFLPYGAYSNAMANFLIGSATYSVRGNLLAFQGFRSWEPNFFVQDDWRATRWLTLNLGVRYEVYPPFVEVNNLYSNFDMSSLQIKLAGKDTSRALGVNTDYKDISPRLGFAATLSHGMVLRGGYGISYYPGDSFNSIQNLNPPYGYSCLPCFGTPFPNLPLPTASSISNPSGGVTVKPPDQLERADGERELHLGARAGQFEHDHRSDYK